MTRHDLARKYPRYTFEEAEFVNKDGDYAFMRCQAVTHVVETHTWTGLPGIRGRGEVTMPFRHIHYVAADWERLDEIMEYVTRKELRDAA
jgi:hypothetical protein